MKRHIVRCLALVAVLVLLGAVSVSADYWRLLFYENWEEGINSNWEWAFVGDAPKDPIRYDIDRGDDWCLGRRCVSGLLWAGREWGVYTLSGVPYPNEDRVAVVMSMNMRQPTRMVNICAEEHTAGQRAYHWCGVYDYDLGVLGVETGEGNEIIAYIGQISLGTWHTFEIQIDRESHNYEYVAWDGHIYYAYGYSGIDMGPTYITCWNIGAETWNDDPAQRCVSFDDFRVWEYVP